jgi:hypothetical protein
MRVNQRQYLEKLALQRLRATANDAEEWSFCFRTEGAEGFIYCDWSDHSAEEFDGEIDKFLLDLPWTSDRKEAISRGEADPTALELQQWREARCRWDANNDSEASVAWAVPLRIWSKRHLCLNPHIRRGNCRHRFLRPRLQRLRGHTHWLNSGLSHRWLRRTTAGYALFLCPHQDPYGEPGLEGVYDSLPEAREALQRVGAISTRT